MQPYSSSEVFDNSITLLEKKIWALIWYLTDSTARWQYYKSDALPLSAVYNTK